jgi:hypothetical protein
MTRFFKELGYHPTTNKTTNRTKQINKLLQNAHDREKGVNSLINLATV